MQVYVEALTTEALAFARARARKAGRRYVEVVADSGAREVLEVAQ